jgi:hypothetical protein
LHFNNFYEPLPFSTLSSTLHRFHFSYQAKQTALVEQCYKRLFISP